MEIDNKKMWEFFRRILSTECKISKGTHLLKLKSYIQILDSALKDQGLAVNDNGEIVSIEPEPFEIKKGHWYMCLETTSTSIPSVKWWKGNVYYAVEDWTLKGQSSSYDIDKERSKYFRPATEEEIPQDSQRMVSAKAKEALLHDGELTEFEKFVKSVIEAYATSKDNSYDMPNESAKRVSQKLLSIAEKEIRQKIASEINPEELTLLFKEYVLLKEANGCDGPIITFGADCYKRGIKHCLEEIELKGIIKKG